MDNLDKIKFKEAEAPGWYYKIDQIAGSKISFADGKGSGTGLYKEMQAWIAAGNEIEPQYTAEELTEKEAKEQVDAQLSISSTARAFLNANDWKLLRHIRQEKRTAMGEQQEMSLSDQEFSDLLEECERQANLVVDPTS